MSERGQATTVRALITVVQSGAWRSVYGLMRVSNPNLAAARPHRLISEEDKVVCLPHQAPPRRAGDVFEKSPGHGWKPLSPRSLSTSPSLHLHSLSPPLSPITFGFLLPPPPITSAVAYYNLEMDFKRELEEGVPEWEKHGLAQWKQIKWACQTSRFVRNK